jgi:hypothetical protein
MAINPRNVCILLETASPYGLKTSRYRRKKQDRSLRDRFLGKRSCRPQKHDNRRFRAITSDAYPARLEVAVAGIEVLVDKPAPIFSSSSP